MPTNRQRSQFFYSWDDVPIIIDAVMAARILGYTVEHTRLLLQQGKIPAHKMGKDWRISKAEFRAFIEGVNNR
mgnify:CR=1 FL=1